MPGLWHRSLAVHITLVHRQSPPAGMVLVVVVLGTIVDVELVVVVVVVGRNARSHTTLPDCLQSRTNMRRQPGRRKPALKQRSIAGRHARRHGVAAAAVTPTMSAASTPTSATTVFPDFACIDGLAR